jgi:hypothetical protein
MIDAHIHVVPPRLPGVGSLSPLLDAPPTVLADALRQEMQTADITQALAMGCLNNSPDDPLGIAETLALARSVPGLFAIGITDPSRPDADHLRRVEASLATKQVRALEAISAIYITLPITPAIGHTTNWPRAISCR